MASEPESKARKGNASSALLVLLHPIIALLSYIYAIPKFFVMSLGNAIYNIGQALRWSHSATRKDNNMADVRYQTSRTKQVLLNVGGKKFTVPYALLSKADNRIRDMLSGDDKITFDRNGIPFIDRDSKHFSTILEALRGGAVVSLTADKQLLLEILSEAIFYKLKVLVEACQQRIQAGGTRGGHALHRIAYKEDELQRVVHSKEPAVIFTFNTVTALGLEYRKMFSVAMKSFAKFRQEFPRIHFVLDQATKTNRFGLDFLYDGTVVKKLDLPVPTPTNVLCAAQSPTKVFTAAQAPTNVFIAAQPPTNVFIAAQFEAKFLYELSNLVVLMNNSGRQSTSTSVTR